ncbi:Her-1-like protein [Ancylostoma duodenale]|uniref:Her-1-like protein n=1 Tax=Ancylostoma duodenale TaxID=51022 RepID=A0A0C2FXP6_9BILA|nr:Her-1-like protein [Ancylostoma duodenale]
MDFGDELRSLWAMTYPHPTHTLLGTIIIASIVVADVKIDSRQISSRCCPQSRRKCCEEVIEKRQPLNCSMPLHELIASSDCIQKEMFGKKSLELARIEDVECCRVFTNEAKDADGTCVKTCVRALRSPSVRSIDTLKSIKSCRPDNKDYTAIS